MKICMHTIYWTIEAEKVYIICIWLFEKTNCSIFVYHLVTIKFAQFWDSIFYVFKTDPKVLRARSVRAWYCLELVFNHFWTSKKIQKYSFVVTKIIFLIEGQKLNIESNAEAPSCLWRETISTVMRTKLRILREKHISIYVSQFQQFYVANLTSVNALMCSGDSRSAKSAIFTHL